MQQSAGIVRRHRTRIVVAALGLVVLVAGVAAAAVGLNQVTSYSVANNSITGVDIRNASVYSADIRDGGLLGRDVKADAITGREVAERTLGVPANISQTLAATEVADAAAGNALPETLLLSRGDLSLTATCWRQADTGALHGDVQLRTAVNGALMSSTLDSKAGGTAAAVMLNIDTPKLDRQVASPNTAANSFRISGDVAEFTAWAAGGDYMRGGVNVVLQNGAVAGVTPPLGEGNRCHVVGFVSAVAA